MERRGGTAARPARSRSMPKVYGALFDISALRDDVHDLRGVRGMSDYDAQRILTHLQRLESAALLLIERFELLHEVAAH